MSVLKGSGWKRLTDCVTPTQRGVTHVGGIMLDKYSRPITEPGVRFDPKLHRVKKGKRE